MVVLDSCALIRLFTNDDPQKVEQVIWVMESGETLVIPNVVFAELDYVFRGVYKIEREKIAEIFAFLLQTANVKVSEEVFAAVDLYRQVTLDMYDCLVFSQAQQSHAKLFTFDKEMKKKVVKLSPKNDIFVM